MRKVQGDAVPAATLLDPRLTVRASTGPGPAGAMPGGEAGDTGVAGTGPEAMVALARRTDS